MYLLWTTSNPQEYSPSAIISLFLPLLPNHQYLILPFQFRMEWRILQQLRVLSVGTLSLISSTTTNFVFPFSPLLYFSFIQTTIRIKPIAMLLSNQRIPSLDVVQQTILRIGLFLEIPHFPISNAWYCFDIVWLVGAAVSISTCLPTDSRIVCVAV